MGTVYSYSLMRNLEKDGQLKWTMAFSLKGWSHGTHCGQSIKEH